MCGCTSSFDGKQNVNSGNGDINGKKALTTDMQLSVGEVAPFGDGNVIVMDMSGREVLHVKAVADGLKRKLKGSAWSKDSAKFAVLYSDDQGTEVIVYCIYDPSPCGKAMPRNTAMIGFRYLAFSRNPGFVLISIDGKDVEELPIKPIPPPSSPVSSPVFVKEIIDAGANEDIEVDAGKLKPVEERDQEDFETGTIPERTMPRPSVETGKVVGGKL